MLSHEGLLISLNPKTACFSLYHLLSSVKFYVEQVFVTDFPIMFLCYFSIFNCGALSVLWSPLLYISCIVAPPLFQHFSETYFICLDDSFPIVLTLVSS